MEQNPRKEKGHSHPISLVTDKLVGIFAELGFEVAHGPELETEFYNFDALNFPKDHPARDMQDTFWLARSSAADDLGLKQTALNSERRLLRTHTSPVQIRYMQANKPPFRIIVPGKVFRNEATDATHEAQFFQLEALYVDKDVSLGHLKGTLTHMFAKLFGDETEIRFRPSFFPFTEPSVEVDASCFACKKAGCRICKGLGWIEMGGAGMVHPNVLKASGVDGNVWRGFAFGFGIDRLVMLKYGIPDVRLLYAGDLRLVNQF